MLGDIERVLEALNSAGVRYLIVGGIADVLHGHLRTTADLDLVIELERGNVLRAMNALASLGYRPRAPVPAEAFADEKHRESSVRDKGLTVFSLWSSRAPTLEVDLFVREPFDFADVATRALKVPLENTFAWVASLQDLHAGSSRSRRFSRGRGMKEDNQGRPHRSADGFDRGWDGQRRRQARIGLRLSPLERLRWLEQTMDEMRRLLGRARAVQRKRQG